MNAVTEIALIFNDRRRKMDRCPWCGWRDGHREGCEREAHLIDEAEYLRGRRGENDTGTKCGNRG